MHKDRILGIISAVMLVALLVAWLFFRSFYRDTWIICQWLMLIPTFLLYDPYDSTQDYGCIFMFSSLTVFLLSFLIVNSLRGSLNDSESMSISQFMDGTSPVFRIFCALIFLAGLVSLIICTRSAFVG